MGRKESNQTKQTNIQPVDGQGVVCHGFDIFIFGDYISFCHQWSNSKGEIFESARIRTQNSCVTVDHSNHVAKELTQQRGCKEWHCHYIQFLSDHYQRC